MTNIMQTGAKRPVLIQEYLYPTLFKSLAQPINTGDLYRVGLYRCMNEPNFEERRFHTLVYLSKKRPYILLYAVMTYFFLTGKIAENKLCLFPDENTSLNYTFIILGIFALFYRISQKSSTVFALWQKILIAFLSSVFSFMSVAGIYFSSGSFIGILHYQTINGNWYKTLIVFAGGFFLFSYFFIVCDIIRQNSMKLDNILKFQHLKGLRNKFYMLFFEKGGCFAKSVLILTVIWLPQLMIRYPGSLPVDGANGLLRYYGTRKYTTQHPVIHSLLIGKCTDIGFALKSPELGLFLFVLLQTAAMILVLAYTIHVMNKLRIPRWFITFSLLLFFILPVFSGYTSTILQDIPYTIAILLFVDELACHLFLPETHRSVKHYLFIAAAVLGSFFRYNGLYVILVVLFFMIIYELFMIIKKKQRVFISAAVILSVFIPLCSGKAGLEYLEKRLEAENVSSRAMLALPMQQTARCFAVNSDSISDDIYQGIRSVLDWEASEYREIYNPLSFDSIKGGFKNDATSEEIAAFLKSWLKLLIQYPDDCISATLAQNYCLFSPTITPVRYYDKVADNLKKCNTRDFSSVYEESSSLHSALDKNLTMWYRFFCCFPVTGLLVTRGIYIFLLLALCLYALFDKNYSYLILCIPSLITLAITFVGPTAYTHQRYTFPILYCMPLLFGLFLTKRSKADSDQEVKTHE